MKMRVALGGIRTHDTLYSGQMYMYMYNWLYMYMYMLSTKELIYFLTFLNLHVFLRQLVHPLHQVHQYVMVFSSA